jgi:signal transduction histidine kinase
VTVEAETVPGLSSTAAAVIYRIAKEAIAATAGSVDLWYGPAAIRGRSAARLEIREDGPAEEGELRDDALRLVRSQVAELGGQLTVDARDGGTLLAAVVPTGDHRIRAGSGSLR